MKHKVKRKQPNSKMCFICGLKNKFGLQASFFETDNNENIAIFKPCEEHQGYPGRLHGGIAAAILDETIGRAITIGKAEDVWSVTLELSIKYKKPVPIGEEIKATGRITSIKNRVFEGTGEIILPNGDIAVIAEGKYLLLPIEKIADFDLHINEWQRVSSPSDPKIIDT